MVKKSISEPILYSTLKHFMLFQLIFGFYYDFIETNSNFVKYLIKLTCFVLAPSLGVVLIVVIYSVETVDTISKIWYSIYIIEYILIVIINLSTKSTFAEFYKKFQDIDCKLMLKKSSYFFMLLRILSLILMTLVIRCCFTYYFCLWFPQKCMKSSFMLILSVYILIATDIFRFVIFLTFSINRCRLKALRNMIEVKCSEKKFKSWIDEYDVMKHDITYYQDIFKEIADNFDYIKSTVDPLVNYLLVISFFI